MYRQNYFQGGGIGGRAAAFAREGEIRFPPATQEAMDRFLMQFGGFSAGSGTGPSGGTAPGLFFWGPPGTGKTVAGYWVTSKTRARKWQTATDRGIIGDFRRTLDAEANECTREGWMRSFYDADAFFLDDLCSGKGYTEWESGVLNEVIDRLYQMVVPVVLTSNLSLPDLSGRLGDRVSSRIAEMCEVVKMGGADYRLSREEGR